MPDQGPERKTRIQRKRETRILDCALEVFSTYGFHGTTIDQIAAMADMSKPNLLYYYRSKELIYQALLARTLEGWLDPFLAIDPKGDPIAELTAYIHAKMEMSFDNPAASRLFAIEVQSGGDQVKDFMSHELKRLVDEKARVIGRWMDDGKIQRVDPYHLIFSIWSVTQHYADFAVQIDALLGPRASKEEAKAAVTDILLRGLRLAGAK